MPGRRFEVAPPPTVPTIVLFDTVLACLGGQSPGGRFEVAPPAIVPAIALFDTIWALGDPRGAKKSRNPSPQKHSIFVYCVVLKKSICCPCQEKRSFVCDSIQVRQVVCLGVSKHQEGDSRWPHHRLSLIWAYLTLF